MKQVAPSAVVVACLLLAVSGAAQVSTPNLYTQLRWRYVGPPGNRTDTIAGIPGDPLTYYVGAASGGIFKTTDGGFHWAPIFDNEPVQSIGALAVARSDHNVLWAGTGEAFIRSNISIGDGVYKSTDAGQTWQAMNSTSGLDKSGRISRIAIDPNDADTVFVCALGTTYGDQPARGLFRTTDGGGTWTKVLFVDEKTGCSDVAIDPSNPRIVYAGMWQFIQHTWGQESGGPGSGLFKSTDRGVTWIRLDGGDTAGVPGLPYSPLGKINIAIAQSNPERVYALIETGDGFLISGKPTQVGVLWATNDGGAHWEMISSNDSYQSRTHYFNHMAVSTDNENECYFIGEVFLHSLDGGRTTVPFAQPGGDNHEVWIDPTNANNMAVANDSGVSISHDRGRVWNHMSLPIAQAYHVTVDDQIPYRLFGNVQDLDSYIGPSQTGNAGGGGYGGSGAAASPRGFPTGGPIPSSDWHGVGGGESGFATPDPVNNNIIWSSGSGDGSQGGIVTRLDLRTGQLRNVEVWPESTVASAAAPLKYRFGWMFPLAISPFDHNRVYVGSQYVHVTTDGGNSWQVISPDLTLNDKSKQQPSGGLTLDNIGPEYFDIIFSIAESPKQEGLIWAGTNDGLVQVTKDGGKNWTNVTKNIPGILQYGTVDNLYPSEFAAGTAYISVDGHQVDNRDPHIFKTTDFGITWTEITRGLPHTPTGYVHCVIEDTARRGLLFAGTEGGVYVSFDDGGNWQPLQNNLPHAPVYWLTIQKTWHDLVIATYGRGFWILDDISPLEQLPVEVTAPMLFPPRKAYEFHFFSGGGYRVRNDITAGTNPPPGADINYYLPEPAREPVHIAIVNAAGETVRTLDGGKAAGFNRVWWDLHGPTSRQIMLRTVLPNMPEATALNAQGERSAPWSRRVMLTEPPGTYSVKLSVDGKSYTQPLEIAKDPRSPATEAVFQSQFKLQEAILDEVNELSELISRIELTRVQIHALGAGLQMVHDAALHAQADAIDRKLFDSEAALYKNQTSDFARGDEERQGPELSENLTHLFQVVTSSDDAPTTQDLAVNEVLVRKLKQARMWFDGIINNDIEAFNRQLRKDNLGSVGTIASDEGRHSR